MRRKFIIEAIVDIIRSSIDKGDLLTILKKAWITPTWKGGPKEDPKEYWPKLAERVKR